MEVSNLLDFLPLDDWVIGSNLLRPQFPIVERTFVFVRVSVHRTEEASTTTCETRKTNFLFTEKTFVLLLFGGFFG